MNCPQCGNQWDPSRGPCPRCGFALHPANHPEQMASRGAFQTQTAYPDTRFSSQREAWTPTAESARGEIPLPNARLDSLARPTPSTGSLPENRSLSENLSSFEQTSPARSASQPIQPLAPGTSLRRGRYSLQERLGQQSWRSGVFEASWLGRDFRYGGTSVLIYEVIVPDPHSLGAHTMLRASTYALLAAGRHSSIPTLQDVFNDQDRAFFVFEPFKGESLQARLQHLGHPLSEQEVVTLCVQMTEVLELLASQSPPLIHGRIYPEHIYLSYDGSRCILSDFSPIMATGAQQFILEAIQIWNSPYAAPEFTQGLIDARGDLYSLIATAYYAVTGMVPAASGGTIPHAQHFNTAISPDFDAILAKGLHPVPQQRYQHAAELRQDLLAVRSRAVSGNPVGRSQVNEPTLPTRRKPEFTFASSAQTPDPAFPFPIMPNLLEKSEGEDEEGGLLPSPERLPAMREGNAPLEAAVILTVVLLSLGVATVLSNFHV